MLVLLDQQGLQEARYDAQYNDHDNTEHSTLEYVHTEHAH